MSVTAHRDTSDIIAFQLKRSPNMIKTDLPQLHQNITPYIVHEIWQYVLLALLTAFSVYLHSCFTTTSIQTMTRMMIDHSVIVNKLEENCRKYKKMSTVNTNKLDRRVQRQSFMDGAMRV